MTENITPEGRGQAGQSAAQRLALGRKRIFEACLHSCFDPAARTAFEQEHAALVDAFLVERLGEIAPDIVTKGGAFAIVAVGGYGRRELCPHSDVDLLILSEKEIPAMALDLAQPLFLALWDQGCDLGHGFRTIKDCLDLAARDFQVLASLLDLRHVAGERSVCDALRRKLESKVLAKKRNKFLIWLKEMQEQRTRRFGDASARLEPQLKDGIGGLRDYHRMLWLAHFLDSGAQADCPRDAVALERLRPLFPDAGDFEEFRQDVRFIFATRNQLHLQSGRKNDVLHQNVQPAVAEALGFRDTDRARAVEAFLGRLHRAMASVKALSRSFWKSHAGVLLEDDAIHAPQEVAPGVELVPGGLRLSEGVEVSPLICLDLFNHCAQLNAPLEWGARRTVRAVLHQAAEAGRSPAGWEAFVDILSSGNAAMALEQMLETGFLDAFFPPFGAVRDLVQFDAYHTHPVGWHTIVVIRELESLHRLESESPRLRHLAELWAELENRHVLLLAALFHDLGKGGAAHEEISAKLAEQELALRGVPREEVETVASLVRNHLLLPATATRSDLGDEAVVMRCANTVGSIARLRMLYLLTYADCRATGPKAWNDWTARLVAELYHKVLHMLEEGALMGARAARTIMKTRDDVRGLAKVAVCELEQGEVEVWLQEMPPQYTLRVAARDIIRHLKLAYELQRSLREEKRRLGEGRAGRGLVALDARPQPDSDIWELAVAAKRQTGLFCAIAGVLSLHDLNIYSADAFNWGDGTSVALFQVSAPLDPLYAEELWPRIRGSLKFAMTGKLSLDYRLAQKRSSVLRSPRGKGGIQVNVDNESTDFYTVIEVLAWDRLGLLYEIASCLNSLLVEVHMAKVATLGDQVADYFYVRDMDGQKLEEEAQIHELRQALLHRLSRAMG